MSTCHVGVGYKYGGNLWDELPSLRWKQGHGLAAVADSSVNALLISSGLRFPALMLKLNKRRLLQSKFQIQLFLLFFSSFFFSALWVRNRYVAWLWPRGEMGGQIRVGKGWRSDLSRWESGIEPILP